MSQIKSKLLNYINKFRYIIIISILGVAYLVDHSNHTLEYKMKFSIPMSGDYPAIPANELSKKIMRGDFYSSEIINQCIKSHKKNINGISELKKIMKVYTDPINYNITLVFISSNGEDYTKCVNLIFEKIRNEIEPVAINKIRSNISNIKKLELELGKLTKIKKYLANYHFKEVNNALKTKEDEILIQIERLSRSIQYKKMEIIGNLDIKNKYIFNEINIGLLILLLAVVLIIIKINEHKKNL
jgi:hypothetical protein